MKPINVSNTTLSLYGARRHRKFDAKQSKKHNYGTALCAVCDKVFTKYHWNTKVCSEECKREKLLAYRRKYDEENREKIKAQKRKYREENREKLVARSRKHYEENREKELARARARYHERKNKRKNDSSIRCQK